MNPTERPREKFWAYGAQAVTIEELMAILLRTGYKGKSVMEVSRDIINLGIGKELALTNIVPQKLMQVKGIGRDKAVTICAAIELGKRLSQIKAKQEYEDFSNPKAVAGYMMDRMRYLLNEVCYVALLTSKNKLIDMVQVSTGGINASFAEQRHVFRKAIDGNAASIILLHNHPSGDPTPSKQDISMTKTFIKAGEIMGILLLDHVIIGDGIYTSLNELGYFK